MNPANVDTLSRILYFCTMATIIDERYSFDLSTDDAVKNILELAQAVGKYEIAVEEGREETNKFIKSESDLIKSQNILKKALNDEVKTLDGLNAKKKALIQIEGRLNVRSKEQLEVRRRIVEIEEEIAAATSKTAGEQKSLIGIIKESAAGYGALIGAGVGVAAIGEVFSQVKDRADELNQKVNEVRLSVRGLTEEQAQNLTGDIEASSQTFNVDFGSQVEAIKAATNEFNESSEEIFSEIQLGLIRSTSDRTRDELLENLREYSTFFRQAGLSFADSVEVINLGDTLGVFADKASDAIKETSIRLGEQTKGTVEAVINAFGQEFSDNLFNDINNGLPTFEALQRISEEIGRTDLNPQQYTELVAAIGGGALEDAGTNFLRQIKNIGDGTDGITDNLNDFQKAQLELLEVNRETARVQVEIAQELEGLSAQYDLGAAKVRLFVVNGLLLLLNVLKEIPDFVRQNKVELAGLATSLALLRLNSVISGVKALSASFVTLITRVRTFNLLSRANPYALLASGVIALVSALSILNKSQDETARLSKKVEEASKEVSRQYITERAEVDKLFKSLGDANTSREDKKKIIDQINTQYGGYLDNLLTEQSTADEIATAYQKINRAILSNIVARAKEAAAKEIIQDQIDRQLELNRVLDSGLTATETILGLFKSFGSPVPLDPTTRKLIELGNASQESKKELSELDEVFKQVEESLANLFGDIDLSFIAPDLDTPNASANRVTGENIADEKDVEDTVKAVEGSIAFLRKQLSDLQKELNEQTDVGDSERLASVLSEIERYSELIEEAENRIELIRQRIANEGQNPPTLPPLEISPVVSTEETELPSIKVPVELDTKPTREEVIKLLDDVQQLSDGLFSIFSELTSGQVSRLDGLVTKQEEAIRTIEANSKEYNARQLEIEKDRLAKLEQQQQRAAERQAAIALTQTVANSILAVTKAAAEGGILAPVTIATTLAAIAAGIAAARELTNLSLFEGIDYVPLGRNPRGKDTVPARLHEGEAVIQADMNKTYHPTVKAVRRGQIPPELLNGFVRSYRSGGMDAFAENMGYVRDDFKRFANNSDVSKVMAERGYMFANNNVVLDTKNVERKLDNVIDAINKTKPKDTTIKRPKRNRKKDELRSRLKRSQN